MHSTTASGQALESAEIVESGWFSGRDCRASWELFDSAGVDSPSRRHSSGPRGIHHGRCCGGAASTVYQRCWRDSGVNLTAVAPEAGGRRGDDPHGVVSAELIGEHGQIVLERCACWRSRRRRAGRSLHHARSPPAARHPTRIGLDESAAGIANLRPRSIAIALRAVLDRGAALALD